MQPPRLSYLYHVLSAYVSRINANYTKALEIGVIVVCLIVVIVLKESGCAASWAMQRFIDSTAVE